MRRNSKVFDVLHLLLHMADRDEPLSSEFLAGMLQTNSVVVRRTLGGLRDSGLVGSFRGRTGGWTLTCDLSQVTLLDIYHAVGQPTLFSIGPRNKAANCLVEKTVNNVLSESVVLAETVLMKRFAEITLQELYEGFRRDMDEVRENFATTCESSRVG